jgi:hypothetical protein
MSGDLVTTWERPTQVGVDADWQAVASSGHTVALKQDGSLWGWGGNKNGQLGQPEADYVPAPVQIGAATNWTHITAGQDNTLAANRDGEVWEWGWVGQPPRGTGEGARRLWIPRRIASGIVWKKLFDGSWGLSTLGEVWILRRSAWAFGMEDRPVRCQVLGVRDAMLGWNLAWSIDGEGRLLRWTEGPNSQTRHIGVPTANKPRRVGSRSDWVAVGGNPQWTLFGLTADGGLWTWGMPLMPLGKYENTWLPPSQRPHQVALLRAEVK